jgi:hypothetical protein
MVGDIYNNNHSYLLMVNEFQIRALTKVHIIGMKRSLSKSRIIRFDERPLKILAEFALIIKLDAI